MGRTLPERDIPPTGLGAALRYSADGQQVSIDPAIIGGVQVSVGDEIINGTVAGRLEDARRQLINL